MVDWLALLLCMRWILGLNLGPEIGYSYLGFCGFPQSLKENAEIVP
jgi:hypothetical protein